MELNIESQKQEFLTICRASIQREYLCLQAGSLRSGRLIPLRGIWKSRG